MVFWAYFGGLGWILGYFAGFQGLGGENFLADIFGHFVIGVFSPQRRAIRQAQGERVRGSRLRGNDGFVGGGAITPILTFPHQGTRNVFAGSLMGNRVENVEGPL